MTIDSFCHHLAHPFHAPHIQLKTWEKCVAYCGFALSIFALVPGFVAFYGLAYYFKSRHVVKQPSSPMDKTSRVGHNSLSTSSTAKFEPVFKARSLPNFHKSIA